MERIAAFFKKLHLQKLAVVFVAGVALLLATACSSQDMQASRQNRSNDIPVQAGANNNPYTMGNDSKGEPAFRSEQAKRSFSKQQSDASISNKYRLVASTVSKNDESDILYQSAEQEKRGLDKSRPAQSQAYSPETIPARRQPNIDRSDSNENIMENIGDQFKEASEFLKDDLKSSVNNAKSRTVPSRSGETR